MNLRTLLQTKSFWLGFSLLLSVCVVGMGVYVFLLGLESKHSVDDEGESTGARAVGAADRTLDSSGEDTSILRSGKLSEAIGSERAVEVLLTPNQYTLEELVSTVDFLIRDEHSFPRVLELLDSVRDDDYRNILRQLTLNQMISDHGVESVFDVVSSKMSGHLRETILLDVTQNLAQISPRDAISLVNRTSNMQLRDTLFESVILTWTEIDPSELYDNLDLFSSEWAYRYGALHASLGIARATPQSAIELLPEFEGTLLEEFLVEEIARKFALEDPKKALAWVESGEAIPPEMRVLALSAVLKNLARSNPDLAYERALEADHVAAAVLKQIATHDLERAAALLTRYQDVQNSVLSYQVVGEIMVQQKQFENAITLGNQVPEYLQESYFDGIFAKWSVSNPMLLMERIPTLPEGIRLRATMQMIVSNQTVPVLEKEQTKYLWSLIPERSAESYKLSEMLTSPLGWSVHIHLPNGDLKMLSGSEIRSALLLHERLGNDL